ncbi:MAG: Dabb family protein [Flavobacteriaceae bacterium]|nr:Dabb family protein [Flavobacteriaceae bacterium]NNK29086.1 Dabb family protein [Flavobacteriaceae bacterium]
MSKLYLIPLIIIVLSCNPQPDEERSIINENNTSEASIIPGSFAHTVYFWLHEPKNQDHRKSFETSLKKFLNTSKNITTKHIGIPASTNREVIDNSYTYSLLLTFKDKEAQDRYQEEPAHKLFIEESSGLWSKVLVYDSVNIIE